MISVLFAMRKFIKSLFRAKRSNESAIRYGMWLMHLWLGLLCSLIVFLTSLSGAVYAFKTQVIELSNWEKVFIYPEADPISLGQLQAQLSKQNKKLLSVHIPESRSRSWQIGYENTQGQVQSVHFNPYLKEELGGSEVSLNRFFEVVLDFHRTLLLGELGKQVIGVGVLLFLLLMVSGIVLWVPKKLKYLKQGFVVKWDAKFARLNYDLHKVVGFYSMLLLFFISVTGLYVTYPWVKNTLIVSLGGTPLSQIAETGSNDGFEALMEDMLARQKELSGPEVTAPISLDSLMQKTHQMFTSPGDLTLTLPTAEDPRYNITKLERTIYLGALLPSTLSFDANGELKSSQRFTELPLDRQFTALVKPLHTGEILGLPSIILYFIASLCGCLLPVTGFLIWYRRFVKS